MNIIEFQNIVDEIVKHHTSIRFAHGQKEYVGVYKGMKTKVILTNSVDRCIVINGWKYHFNYTEKELKGERCI